MSDQNTREKILKIARVLFADNGFDGTSIRDIATSADVNVASVNYHFSSKENLYMEIMAVGYRECSEEMRSFIEKENPTLEQALIHLFRHFLSKSHDLVSSFKLLMSAQLSHQVMSKGTEDHEVGPPGGKAVMRVIAREIGAEVGNEDLHFAMKVLFNHVTHQALIYHCVFRHQTGVIPFSSVEDIEKGIRRLCKIILNDLKKP